MTSKFILIFAINRNSAPVMIRKATVHDIDRIERIYDAIHDSEEAGTSVIGWRRGVYPTRLTASEAVSRGDLYVLDDNGIIQSAAIINKVQLPEYRLARWHYEAQDDEVLVLHTLVVNPDVSHCGYGSQMVKHYIAMGHELGCKVLRIDTQACNAVARRFYPRFGFQEAGIVKADFFDTTDDTVDLVLLEKPLCISSNTNNHH